MNIAKILRLTIVSLMTLLLANISNAASWSGLRTSGAGTSGWQPLVCENGNGWRSCEMPVNVTLVAAPGSLVAIGEQATIYATVTDYYGVPIAGSRLNWTSTSGALWPTQTTTNAAGVASITIASSNTLGGTAVTATTFENDGSGAVWVPFTDKFVAVPSTFTAWADTGAPYNCTAWSPETSTVAAGTGFWQTANCWQDQLQYRQDRESSLVTGAIRDVGGPVPGYQSIVVSQTQFAMGTEMAAAPVCSYNPGRNQSGILTTTPTQWSLQDPDGDLSLSDNGPTGITIERSGAHDGEVWQGHVDYNGYRYTVGKKRTTYNIGRNFVYYLFEMCKTPL
jgi:hypothetical protein